MDFRKWLDMRLEEAANKTLFKEVGVGIWINPDDEVFEFKDVIHAVWADVHGMSMNDMIRSGWVRMRVTPDATYAETMRTSAIWAITNAADAHGVKKVQMLLKGRNLTLHKTDVWRLDDKLLSDVFEEWRLDDKLLGDVGKQDP